MGSGTRCDRAESALVRRPSVGHRPDRAVEPFGRGCPALCRGTLRPGRKVVACEPVNRFHAISRVVAWGVVGVKPVANRTACCPAPCVAVRAGVDEPGGRRARARENPRPCPRETFSAPPHPGPREAGTMAGSFDDGRTIPALLEGGSPAGSRRSAAVGTRRERILSAPGCECGCRGGTPADHPRYLRAFMRCSSRSPSTTKSGTSSRVLTRAGPAGGHRRPGDRRQLLRRHAVAARQVPRRRDPAQREPRLRAEHAGRILVGGAGSTGSSRWTATSSTSRLLDPGVPWTGSAGRRTSCRARGT